VNYTKGMVLGVDDFTQEFAYLSGRDQWIVRELLGYGTSSGLAVEVTDTADGPQVSVAPGAAAVPSGKLVRVPSKQCGLLNKWLAKPENAAEIPKKVVLDSPPSAQGTLSLYLVLCYADCTTLPVPIPGDPCRSEDQLMADSRIADDYRLELRLDPPPQVEEDALRDFVAWLRQVPIVDPEPATGEKDWLAALRAAVQPWFDNLESDSPMALDDYFSGKPPAGLEVGKSQQGDFLRVAFRLWATQLRPLWMARICAASPKPADDCLLLARLDVPVLAVGSPDSVWQAAGPASAVEVQESLRPTLVESRLLQEWVLSGDEPSVELPHPGLGVIPVGNGQGWTGKLLEGTQFQLAVQQLPTAIRLSLPQDIAPASSPAFASLTAGSVAADSDGLRTAGLASSAAVQIAVLPKVSADLVLDHTHHLVVCADGLTVSLPKCDPKILGRTYIVKCESAAASGLKLVPDPADTVDGGIAVGGIVPLKPGQAVTVVSDGDKVWHVVAAV
jgi:hypothetical protein